MKASPAKGQPTELHATEVIVYGWADPETYPLQKKRHSFEFLRTLAHLRPRTNTFGAVARVRNCISSLDPRVLPGAGLPLHSDADHHQQRLRRARARCSA